MDTALNPQVPAAGIGGLVPYQGIVAMEGQAAIDAREEAKAKAQEANNRPVIQGLAGHVRNMWSVAKQAKEETVEPRMFQAMRQRRGEYDPDVLAEIKKLGGSEIYMMLTSNKCRAAASWIRDVMLGTRDEKPWTISPTPLPELPPQIDESVMMLANAEADEYERLTGQLVGQQELAKITAYVKDRIIANARKRAEEACERMELKMEDQLVEGGFQRALAQFIEDIVTFPAAILKGPVVRKKAKLRWVPAANGAFDCVVEDQLTLEWDRVDPFMAYPLPQCADIEDGGFIERHRLSRQSLTELRGVEGYSEAAINAVLEEFGRGGLREWLMVDTTKAEVEGKSVAAAADNPEGLIDALQYWGHVQGSLLIEWGMDKDQVPDPLKDYQCEVWLIGSWVIKAVVNPDKLGRKPYFKASYEEIPGAFWGNAVTDLCRDAQSQCNTAARAMANNMGVASGPQVGVNVDRLPTGEDITMVFPWKIWQTTSDPYGSTAKPVEFFQPGMISAELMNIYQFWSAVADEHTGVPRYMTGDMGGSSAMRTASQTSMMMNNAGKAIKQVIANIDAAIQCLLERLYYHNMLHSEDVDLKGDINIIARGANSLIVKETAQQRRNEFLQLCLTNPIVQQIVGPEAIAALLRENVKTMDMDVDSIIPRPEVIRARMYMQEQQAAAAQKAAQDFQTQLALAPSKEIEVERGPDGEVLGMKVIDKQPHVMPMPGFSAGGQTGGGSPAQTMTDSGQQVNGTPVTDNFSQMRH